MGTRSLIGYKEYGKKFHFMHGKGEVWNLYPCLVEHYSNLNKLKNLFIIRRVNAHLLFPSLEETIKSNDEYHAEMSEWYKNVPYYNIVAYQTMKEANKNHPGLDFVLCYYADEEYWVLHKVDSDDDWYYSETFIPDSYSYDFFFTDEQEAIKELNRLNEAYNWNNIRKKLTE